LSGGPLPVCFHCPLVCATLTYHTSMNAKEIDRQMQYKQTTEIYTKIWLYTVENSKSVCAVVIWWPPNKVMSAFFCPLNLCCDYANGCSTTGCAEMKLCVVPSKHHIIGEEVCCVCTSFGSFKQKISLNILQNILQKRFRFSCGPSTHCASTKTLSKNVSYLGAI